jgi:multiple sugar transport system permease protein
MTADTKPARMDGAAPRSIPRSARERRLRRALSRGAIIGCLAIFTVWTLAPILWAVISSLLPQTALTATPPDLSPANITIANFQAVLAGDRSLVKGLINSGVIAVATATVALSLGSAAAYALSRLHVPGSGKLLLAVLATQMFPGIVIIIPLFIVISRLGLTDTYLALIVVYLSFGSSSCRSRCPRCLRPASLRSSNRGTSSSSR